MQSTMWVILSNYMHPDEYEVTTLIGVCVDEASATQEIVRLQKEEEADPDMPDIPSRFSKREVPVIRA